LVAVAFGNDSRIREIPQNALNGIGVSSQSGTRVFANVALVVVEVGILHVGEALFERCLGRRRRRRWRRRRRSRNIDRGACRVSATGTASGNRVSGGVCREHAPVSIRLHGAYALVDADAGGLTTYGPPEGR